MNRLTACPDKHALERLLLGQISEQEAEPLEDHLQQCASCFETLKTLRVADTLIDALGNRSDGAQPSPTEAAAADDLVGRLKGLHSAPRTAKPPPAELTCTPMAVDGATRSGDGLSPLTGVLSPPQQPDEIGRLGPYRVLKVLGSGGMGVVFGAEDLQLKRRVALKVMKPEAAGKPAARERFLREAQAAAALEHEHVVTIYQVGEERGVPFLAMQWLKGISLEERLKGPAPMTMPDVVRLGRQIARGLAAAHERGLVHRDIKPANLWLEPEHGGRIRILDFGLARAMARDARLTQSGDVLGTPAYMAPEQARGDQVDHRCDLFSLGVVLYRMVTGRLPFGGDNAMAVLSALALDTPAPPREVNPAVPAALSDLILQLLAKDPAARPQSAGEVADRLQAVEWEPAAPAPKEAPLPASPAGPRSQAAAAGRLARRRLLLAAGVALLGLVPLSLLLGGTVIHLATNKGVLIIETDDPNLEVSVKDASATIHDRVKDRRFVLTAGDYDVQVREEGDGGVRFATKRFTITRGGQETLNARLELAKSHVKGKWVPLFNGKDLTGWKAYPKGTGNWHVENGAMVSDGKEDLEYLFSDRADFTNFIVRIEARINAVGDSGLAFRAAFQPGFPAGYEAQIRVHEEDPNRTGSLFMATHKETAKAEPEWNVYLLDRVDAKLVKPDEWFDMEVTAVGNRLTVRVNGAEVASYRDEAARYKRGHFAFQVCRDTRVEVRKIEVQELQDGDGVPE